MMSSPVVDWLEIVSTAPAKYVLLGEHIVSYEKQAIAAAIDMKTMVTIRPNNDGVVRLRLKNLDNYRTWPTYALKGISRIVQRHSSLEYEGSMIDLLGDLLNIRFNTNAAGRLFTDEDIRARNQQIAEARKGLGESSRTAPREERLKKADDAVTAFLLLYLGIGDSFCNSARLAIDVEVESDIPMGVGLGASASYSVAMAGGLMKVYLASAEKYVISNWAFHAEKFFHPRPSGLDNTVISQGGYVLYHNSKIKATGFPHRIPIRVLLVDAELPRTTQELTDRVGYRLRRNQGNITALMNTIHDMINLVWRAMNDPEFIPRHISSHLAADQYYYNELGIGDDKLVFLCDLADKHGLTAKQTGSGFVFMLYDPNEDQTKIANFRKEVIAAGYTKIYDQLSGCGGFTLKVTKDPVKQFQPHVSPE